MKVALQKALRTLLADKTVAMRPTSAVVVVSLEETRSGENNDVIQSRVSLVTAVPDHTAYIMLEAALGALKDRVPANIPGITTREVKYDA